MFSYVELDVKVQVVVDVLCVVGVRIDEWVVLLVVCGFYLLLVIFGVQCVGGVYVLINFDYFLECVCLLLEDCGVCVVLVDECVVIFGESFGEMCVLYFECLLQSIGDLLVVNVVFGDLVYVIYIFGLIGMFKGVMVEYCLVVNCLNWMQCCYLIGECDVFL